MTPNDGWWGSRNVPLGGRLSAAYLVLSTLAMLGGGFVDGWGRYLMWPMECVLWLLELAMGEAKLPEWLLIPLLIGLWIGNAFFHGYLWAGVVRVAQSVFNDIHNVRDISDAEPHDPA